jgi:hypothetical protein
LPSWSTRLAGRFKCTDLIILPAEVPRIALFRSDALGYDGAGG